MTTTTRVGCPYHSTGAGDVKGEAFPIRAPRELKDLPGPSGLPLIGNLLQLDLKRLHTVVEQWAETYGPMYRFNIAHKPVVAVSNAELINEVLRKRPTAYRRLASIEPVLKEMGINGVFSAEGNQWIRQRRTAMQALNNAHLRSFFPTLVKVTGRLKCRWEDALRRGAPIDVQDDLMRYTIDVTSNLAFGYDVNTLEGKGDDIQRHLEKVFPMINKRINAPFPYWHFIKFHEDRELDDALVAIREALAEFIAHSQARLDRCPDLAVHPTNFLEAMLAARATGETEVTDEEIFGNVLTMLIGGEDSTAATMAWMLYFLARNQDVQAHVQQEVDEALGEDGMLRDIRDAERLSYLEAVAFETMRLKSVFPILFLGANQEVELGGVRIPQGTAIFLLTRTCGMQESEFADADRFYPGRWMGMNGCPVPGHNPKAFVPFGAGPRFCPGRNLALLEMKSAMAMLFRNFAVTETPAAEPVEERYGFLMAPERLSVSFSPRSPRCGTSSGLQQEHSPIPPIAASVS
jgi:cytochrome P450